VPLHLVYGDDFLVSQALKELRQHVGSPEVMEPNCHYISGSNIDLASLTLVCDAMPFLAEMRLVVVEGALTAADSRGSTAPMSRERPSSGWNKLEDYIKMLPTTTLLVFADGPLKRGNPLLKRLRPLAHVSELPTPANENLARWIQDSVRGKGGQVTPGAITLLSRLVGTNLRVLDSEVDKLILYSKGNSIDESHVNEVVSQAKEANIFSTVDCLVEGRYAEALRSMIRLRENGAEFSYIVAMLTRQLSLVSVAKELLEHGLPPKQFGKRLGLQSEYVVGKTVDQARKLTRKGVIELYQMLLDVDLAVKSGRLEVDVAILLLLGQAIPHR
jgi:DNA polymerase-3 subunit delta